MKWTRKLPDGPTVTIIDCHAGRWCSTGGEYEYRTHYRVRNENEVVVFYSSSAQFPHCSHSGSFRQCDDGCRYEVARVADLEPEIQDAIRLAGETGEDVTIDGTGHDPVPCQFDGGCVVCYPCNHAPCMAGE